MKNAKWISLLAAAALSASVLVGCGAASSAASSAAASSVASAAASAAASSVASTADSAAIEASFTITDAEGKATEYALEATDGESLADALAAAQLISSEEAAAGFVTTVNGVTADYDKDQAWWMLVDQDGQMTATGISEITLHAGDSYGFVYTVGDGN